MQTTKPQTTNLRHAPDGLGERDFSFSTSPFSFSFHRFLIGQTRLRATESLLDYRQSWTEWQRYMNPCTLILKCVCDLLSPEKHFHCQCGATSNLPTPWAWLSIPYPNSYFVEGEADVQGASSGSFTVTDLSARTSPQACSTPSICLAHHLCRSGNQSMDTCLKVCSWVGIPAASNLFLL